MNTVVTTLCLIYDDKRILLGMKKRGFGAGRWNGFGGKVHEGETIEETAKREMEEESGIKVEEIKKRGVITFEFKNPPIGGPEKIEVNFFEATKYSGEPIETDEMKPQWFLLSEIPFDSMWPDDPYWMPLFLAGKNFGGKILFKDQNTILENSIKEVLE